MDPTPRFCRQNAKSAGATGEYEIKLWYWSRRRPRSRAATQTPGNGVRTVSVRCGASAQALLSRRSVRDGLRGAIVGNTLSWTVSFVTTHLATAVWVRT